MRTDAGRGRLYDALKVIRGRWDEVEPHWTDQMRQQFEEKTWIPLQLLTEDLLRALDRLNQVFNQARNECTGGQEVFGS